MVRDEFVKPHDLAIIEKFEAAVTYLYPILQSAPRRHAALRDNIMGLLFEQVSLLYQAAKSRQASKLYAADANMATLRFWLRFAADSETPNLCRTVSTRSPCATWLKPARCLGSGSRPSRATGGRGYEVAPVHLRRFVDQRLERRLPVRELGLLARELEREHRCPRGERRPLSGAATVKASPAKIPRTRRHRLPRQGGRPGRPASANTLQGPVKRGVAASALSKPATGIRRLF